jgi:hypothetical protein
VTMPEVSAGAENPALRWVNFPCSLGIRYTLLQTVAGLNSRRHR